jgi:hypothetical protein
MRASDLLGLIVLFFGMVTTFDSSSTASRAIDPNLSTGSIIQRDGADAARVIAEGLPNEGNARIHWGSAPSASIDRRIAIGETLPDFVELRLIPKHETYRYAIVNNHRVIVDAGSREIVYVVR